MKKTLLSIAMIFVLVMSLFGLTACGDSTEQTSGADSSETVIQVPMTVMNLYPNCIITELYMSGAGLDSWGENVLGSQQMPTGTQIQLNLNIDKNNVKWDIKAVDENGDSVTFQGLDLSDVSTSGGTITLQMDENGNPIAIAK